MQSYILDYSRLWFVLAEGILISACAAPQHGNDMECCDGNDVECCDGNDVECCDGN